jgi:asparagine synthase (glutamine-hydrolysing)
MYEGVRVLPGGVVHWYDDAGDSGERRFWEPHAAPEHVGQDDAHYLAAYRRIVEEATACRVRRLEQAPCLMFSGGFDSGTIAAVAGPIVAERGQAVIAVTSVLNEGEKSAQGDSRKLAEAFAGREGVALHAVARGEMSMVTGLEEGFARSGECFALDYVRDAGFALGRNEGARLAMDGHGGDYTVNMLDPGMLGRILLRGHVWRFWRELWARRAFTRRSLVAIVYGDVLRPLVPQRLMRAFFDWRAARGPVWQRRFAREDFAGKYVAGGRIDPDRLRHPRVAWQRWQGRWLHMQRLQLFGPPAMATKAAAHGLDFTRPFHDIRIVELALAIPEHLQFRDGRERWLARTAFADCLPPSLITRQPGNTPERPGQEAMFAQSLPEALAVLERDWPDSPAARYVEISKLRAALAEGESGPLGWRNPESTFGATNAMIVARFVNWFYRGNGPDQEP